MKKAAFMIAVLSYIFLGPKPVCANMAAPRNADVGSAITFEKNDDISVLSEVLTIDVNGSTADITAVYTMKNTCSDTVLTPAMFLSPNIKDSKVTLKADNRNIPYTVESYQLNYSTEVGTDGWQYAVLSEKGIAQNVEEQTVDCISFEMSFEPEEEYEVIVSYEYRLGGYPDYDFNAKEGRIDYYLTPAAAWKDFENLTINLRLDQDMPVIKDSSLEFKKTGSHTYRYVSETLPEENLRIVIDENWFQNIFSTLKSPYLPFTLMLLSPVFLIAAVLLLFVLFRRIKKKKH